MSNNYKFEFDFEQDRILYKKLDGHKRLSSLSINEISKNPSLISFFSAEDAFLIGTICSCKQMNNLELVIAKPRYKLFTALAMIFPCIFIISNILSTKLVQIFDTTITGALLLYPFSYIFAYIMSDVYGYQNFRRVIWITIFSLILFNISIILLIYLPPSHYWHYQHEVADVFSRMLRTFVASTISFSITFFISSYIFQKNKYKNNKVSLFNRVLKSLLFSEIFDTGVFCIIAFYGVWPLSSMMKFLIISYFTKITYELVVFKFITQPLIEKVKNIEKADMIDSNTNYNPFSWEVKYKKEDNIFY